MNSTPKNDHATRVERGLAWSVHLLTASGAVCAMLAAAAIMSDEFKLAFIWLTIAVVIDGVDGTFARRFRVTQVLPQIDGRKIDDIVDYLNFTFLPIMLICRAGWLPEPVWVWAAAPLVASLLGFAHIGAKEDEGGFFRGFPSYWNIVALYIMVWMRSFGAPFVLVLVLGLSLLTILPVRFVYPNRPPKWPVFFIGGAVFWLITVVGMLYLYPDIPNWLLVTSLIYPTLYVILSIWLDITGRRTSTEN